MKLAISIILLFALCTYSVAQKTSISTDSIVNSYIEAIGLKDKTIRTRIDSGKVVQSGMEIKYKQFLKDNKYYRLEGVMQGSKMIQSIGKEKSWSIMPWVSATPQALEPVQLMLLNDRLDIEGELIRWKTKYLSLKTIDTEDVDNYCLELQKSDGITKQFFIDKESFIIVKTLTLIKHGEMTIEIETEYSNYNYVNDVALPFLIVVKLSGNELARTIIEGCLLNPEIEDVIFDAP